MRAVWGNAERFTLAHDISAGGAALALREAGAWSGLEAELDCPDAAGVLVALDPGDIGALDWGDVVTLGVV